MERVAGEDDPRFDRDLVPRLAVRIAAAVPALVAVADDRADVLELADRAEDPLAELRMRLDDLPLLVRERAGLRQQRRRDADLADVVEERSELDPLQRLRLEAELLADADRQVGDPARVRGRVLVVGLERVRQRLDRGEEGPLHALEAGRVRDREPGLVREPAEQLQLALADVVVGARGDGDRARAAFDDERRDGEDTVGGVDRAVDEGRVLVGLHGERAGVGPGTPPRRGGSRRPMISSIGAPSSPQAARPSSSPVSSRWSQTDACGEPSTRQTPCAINSSRRRGRPGSRARG